MLRKVKRPKAPAGSVLAKNRRADGFPGRGHNARSARGVMRIGGLKRRGEWMSQVPQMTFCSRLIARAATPALLAALGLSLAGCGQDAGRSAARTEPNP